MRIAGPEAAGYVDGCIEAAGIAAGIDPAAVDLRVADTAVVGTDFAGMGPVARDSSWRL